MSVAPTTPLHTHQEFRHIYEELYLHGNCYFFAVALHRGLGWPIFGLIDGQGAAVHAVVRSPEGEYYDVRGKVEEKNIGKPFDLSGPHTLMPVTEEILRLGMEDVGRELHGPGVNVATEAAHFLFPFLPWKEETFFSRVRRFAEELEILSRKYNLWLRSSFPGQPPCISQGVGEESGYDISLLDREDATLTRRFK